MGEQHEHEVPVCLVGRARAGGDQQADEGVDLVVGEWSAVVDAVGIVFDARLDELGEQVVHRVLAPFGDERGDVARDRGRALQFVSWRRHAD